MDKIRNEDVYNEYNNQEQIWPLSDLWHHYTRKRIEHFLEKNRPLIERSQTIINAGSAGESYGIDDLKTIHIDIISERIAGKPHKLVNNLENIPLPLDFADMILCVGSVINYIDLIRAIQEFTRILKIGGYLILEFECSNTLELIFSKNIKSNALIRNTFYRGKPTKIWYYSKYWVFKVIEEFGFEILSKDQWHYISPLALGLTKKMNFSSWFSKFDPVIKYIPLLNKYYSNCILVARKQSS